MKPDDEIRVLVVDDVPANVLAMQAILAELGTPVVAAGSGAEALDKIAAEDFAVVVLDVRMPVMGGFEVARRARCYPHAAQLPIIFVTGVGDDPAAVRDAYALGAVDYLSKPFMPEALKAKVSVFVELKRKSLALAQRDRDRYLSALGEKDERLRLLMSTTKDYAFVVTDTAGRVTEWVGGAGHITGWPAEEVTGQTLDFIFSPEDLASAAPAEERMTAEREGRAENKRWHMRKDGSRFFADGVMVALRGHDGTLRGFAKVFRDATAERRAAETLRAVEDTLRESRDWFSALLDSSGEGIYGIDADGLCTFFNPAGARMLGYEERELVGRRIHELVQHHHGDGAPYPIEECRIGSAARAGSFLRVEDDVFWHREGTAIRVAYSVSPIVLRGRHRGAVVTFTDISKRSLAEERLREVLRIRTVGIIFWGPGFGLTEANDAFLRMSGFTLQEALGKTWQDLTPVEFHPQSLKAVHDVMTFGEATPYEKEYLRKDGSRWWGLFAPRKVGDEVVEFVLDVTERRRAEEALRVADRRKDEFLATLAHELRNPMAPLRNGLQIARMTMRGSDATMTRTIDMMDRQLSHLVRLVDDLLDVGRVVSGKLDIRREPVSVRRVLAASVEASRVLFEAHGHRLSIDIDPGELTVLGDFDRLSQVFTNILTNAAKYTNDGGEIVLTSRLDGHCALVAISDSGIGIPPDEAGEVFELFSQVRAHQGRSADGLGIGLALVKRIVELHHGSVEAQSGGVGRGSTFTVRLPLAPAHETPQPAPSATTTRQTSRRVLVADDNTDAAASLAEMLRLYGHRVWTACDGEEALAMALELRPEVIFLDLGMPRMDGIEVAKRLRAVPAGRDMVLVAVTGWGQPSDRERTGSAGFDGHLVKPVDPATLSTLLLATHGTPRLTGTEAEGSLQA